ncbi:MAG TPA: SARP family transcriptional regulator, partial [Pseudonocardiaceae bacterium]|nr:SARP family transcriptional regulator [Pseudonocardiaceae bacterium]
MSVEFGVLGPVEVTLDGRAIPLKGLRQQGILAVLLVEANRLVSRDQLLDRVWTPNRLPDRPANAIQTQLTLLR